MPTFVDTGLTQDAYGYSNQSTYALSRSVVNFDYGPHLTDTLLMVGQYYTSNTYSISRGVLFVNTLSLPTDIIISDATLSVYVGWIQNGGGSVELVSYSLTSFINPSDFNISNFGSTSFGTIPARASSGIETLTLTDTSFLLQGPNAALPIGMRGTKDVNDISSTTFAKQSIGSNNRPLGERPTLTVTYSEISASIVNHMFDSGIVNARTVVGSF